MAIKSSKSEIKRHDMTALVKQGLHLTSFGAKYEYFSQVLAFQTPLNCVSNKACEVALAPGSRKSTRWKTNSSLLMIPS